MEKILSVIVPSYNMEKYLDQCIGSMTGTSKIDAIEIIIVNDGSTDGTRAIAAAYAEKFPNSVVLVDKENGGHGSAINVGAYMCRGKFFKVIDADDYVDPEQFDGFIDALYSINSDAVVCDFIDAYEASGRKDRVDVTSGLIGRELRFSEYLDKHDLELHSVTYLTETYRGAGIKVGEKRYFDDAEYCLFSYGAIETVTCLPFAVYMYRLEREGQSMSPEGFMRHIDDHRHMMIALCEYYSAFEGEIKPYVLRKVSDHLSFQYGYVAKYGAKSDLAETKKFDAELKERFPEFYSAAKLGRGSRLLRTLRFGCMPVLKIVRKFTAK